MKEVVLIYFKKNNSTDTQAHVTILFLAHYSGSKESLFVPRLSMSGFPLSVFTLLSITIPGILINHCSFWSIHPDELVRSFILQERKEMISIISKILSFLQSFQNMNYFFGYMEIT
jgi:hypothetical protein